MTLNFVWKFSKKGIIGTSVLFGGPIFSFILTEHCQMLSQWTFGNEHDKQPIVVKQSCICVQYITLFNPLLGRGIFFIPTILLWCCCLHFHVQADKFPQEIFFKVDKLCASRHRSKVNGFICYHRKG